MAEATDNIVYWTKVQIGLGVAGSLFLLWTLYETRRTANTAHKEFMATHRPRMRVRSVHIYNLGTTRPMEISVFIVNVGETEATVTHFGADIALQQNGQWEDSVPSPSMRRLDEQAPMKSGVGLAYPASDESPMSRAAFERVLAGKSHLFVVGEVRYVDSIDTVRHTGFIFFYEKHGQRFVPYTDPSYSYED